MDNLGLNATPRIVTQSSPAPFFGNILIRYPTTVSFLDDSRRIAAGNRAGQIYIWQLPEKPPESTGEEQQDNKEKSPPDFAPLLRLDGHANGITRLIATNGGKTLISASLDHTIRLWDLNASPGGSAEVVLDAQTRERKARGKSKEEQEKMQNKEARSLAPQTL